MMYLPNELSSGVIPMDKPEVPNAEQTSNIILIKEKGSVIDSIRIEVKHMIVAIIVTASDFKRSSSYNSLPKTLI